MPQINTKTKEEIIVRILNALEQNANITATSPGSVARAFADAFGTEMFYLYESFKEAVSQSSLSTASGRGLDLIGEMYNVKRKTLSDQLVYERTTANIEFILDKPYISDIIIPRGTLVYNDVGSYNSTQYSYRVANDIVILAGVTKAFGVVNPNFQSNDHVASAGTLTRHNFITPPGVIIFCTNPKEVYPVVNSESDDNYRRRILSAVKVSATGTVEALRMSALSVNGVRDIRVREASFGIGSCEIIIIPDVPGRIGNLPTLVSTAISQVRPLGIRMNVSVANTVPVNVEASITLPYGTAQNLRTGIQNQATIFVKRYLNSLTVGDTMSVQRVEEEIRKSSDLIRSVSITNISAQGTLINRKDFRLQSERDYIVSGDIAINSVIIGLSNY